MTIIIHDIRVVSESDSIKPCQLRFFCIMAIMIVPRAPTAPASVGVKMPRKSPPMTSKKSRNVSIRPERDLIFSLNVVLGPRGPSSGLSVVHIRMVIIKRTVKRRPGRSPAIKSLPMDCSVCMPYTMNITLGGISIPRLPPAATTPVASSGL